MIHSENLHFVDFSRFAMSGTHFLSAAPLSFGCMNRMNMQVDSLTVPLYAVSCYCYIVLFISFLAFLWARNENERKLINCKMKAFGGVFVCTLIHSSVTRIVYIAFKVYKWDV